ncbi:MAG: DUF2336 domain-containing protein [Alphaproteobacteria bacterium]|jgi:uncharacterized protein (DUF2336 family)|nr:DUF2336 domain-containing protein [Alphaproteobacteria bacterium]
MSSLQGLVDLASETSSEKRRELLEQVAGLFLDQPGEMNQNEVGLVDDILTRVAHDVEMKVRQQLSERFADVKNAPQNIVKMLANDDIAVAGPILLRSSVLKDRDLIDIIREKGQEHMLAVSQRDGIGEGVTDVLVEEGNEDVLVSLAGNEGASFSRDGMETLVAKSETIEALQAPLVQRGDLPPDLMHDMFWWVSSTLKEYIMTEAEMDEAVVDEMLAETRDSLVREFEDGDVKMKRAFRKVLKLERQQGINEDFLIQTLRQGEKEEFTVAFSRLAEVDIPTVQRILADPSREGVAVACKASDFSLNTFSSIVLLTEQGGKTRKGSEVAELLDLYNKVPKATAQRAMRFWKVRKKAAAPSPAEPAAMEGEVPTAVSA